jgi:uncharacterized membrane protein
MLDRSFYKQQNASNRRTLSLVTQKTFPGWGVTSSGVPSNLHGLDLRLSDKEGDLTMNRRVFVASALSTAVGLALATQVPPIEAAMKDMSNAPQAVKDNMKRAKENHLQKCYGINAVGKNDCAQGAHSCAGQATQARDPKSFVLLPAGDCAKIQGGKLTPA